MVVVKVEYEGDIRRVTLLDEKNGFAGLVATITELYATGLPKSWILKYKDEDGDFITVTSDRELSEALATAKQTLLRLYIKEQATPVPVNIKNVVVEEDKKVPEKIEPPKPQEPAKPSTTFKPRHQALCDNCDEQIVGIRFKCAICPDYDLCEKCEKLGTVHKHHAFARLYSPADKVSFPSPTATSTIPPPATEEPAAPKIRYHSRFVKDVTIPDGTKIEAGARFIKTWRLRNNGNHEWPEGTTLVNIGGDFLGQVESVPVARRARPDEEVDISVEVEAPRNPGRYVSNWRLSTPNGMHFGHKVWVSITVEARQEKPVETPVQVEKPKEETPKVTAEELKPKEKKVDDDVQGHLRQKLIELYDMGFTDIALNRKLLVKCKGDTLATVHELLKG